MNFVMSSKKIRCPHNGRNQSSVGEMSSLKNVEKRQKQVFKPLLESPFPQSNFPLIDPQVQQQILDFLLLLLKDLGNYNKLKSNASTDKEHLKRIKPSILRLLTLGFNSTVEALEKQVKDKINAEDSIRYVFVCKPDITPQLLVQQLPNLCYMAGDVKLIQLSKGSMNKLESVGGQRLNIIGLKSPKDGIVSKSFMSLLDDATKVPILEIEWLKYVKFQKARINMVKTTMPVVVKQPKNKIRKKK